MKTSISLVLATLLVALSSAQAPAAGPDPAKPLTCEGRCVRLNDNCLRNAKTERDRADCQFERQACDAKCPVKP